MNQRSFAITITNSGSELGVRLLGSKKCSLISGMKQNWICLACVSLVQLKNQFFFRFFWLPTFCFASTNYFHFEAKRRDSLPKNKNPLLSLQIFRFASKKSFRIFIFFQGTLSYSCLSLLRNTELFIIYLSRVLCCCVIVAES